MPENTTWGIHMGAHVGTDPIDNNYVAIGWVEMGDVSQLPPDRELIKEHLVSARPDAKPGAIPGWAGILYRFAHELKAGDFIVYPSKVDRMINIAVATDTREYVKDSSDNYPNRIKVKWLGHFPRDQFSQAALYECGSALTFFKIKNYRNEILAAINQAPAPSTDVEENDETDDETVATEASSKALEVTTDFIIKRLKTGMDAYQFEHFVAHLLECMNYSTRVTQGSGDGGVDIIAHRDELSFEPPIIKVQCKQITDKIGDPVVNQLLGTLGETDRIPSKLQPLVIR